MSFNHVSHSLNVNFTSCLKQTPDNYVEPCTTKISLFVFSNKKITALYSIHCTVCICALRFTLKKKFLLAFYWFNLHEVILFPVWENKNAISSYDIATQTCIKWINSVRSCNFKICFFFFVVWYWNETMF